MSPPPADTLKVSWLVILLFFLKAVARLAPFKMVSGNATNSSRHGAAWDTIGDPVRYSNGQAFVREKKGLAINFGGMEILVALLENYFAHCERERNRKKGLFCHCNPNRYICHRWAPLTIPTQTRHATTLLGCRSTTSLECRTHNGVWCSADTAHGCAKAMS